MQPNNQTADQNEKTGANIKASTDALKRIKEVSEEIEDIRDQTLTNAKNDAKKAGAIRSYSKGTIGLIGLSSVASLAATGTSLARIANADIQAEQIRELGSESPQEFDRRHDVPQRQINEAERRCIEAQIESHNRKVKKQPKGVKKHQKPKGILEPLSMRVVSRETGMGRVTKNINASEMISGVMTLMGISLQHGEALRIEVTDANNALVLKCEVEGFTTGIKVPLIEALQNAEE